MDIDFMKKFCGSLIEHAMKINNFNMKKNEVINKRAAESWMQNPEICHICQEKFQKEHVKDKKYYKVRDHCHYTGEYRGAAYSICNLKYSVPKKFPIALAK